MKKIYFTAFLIFLYSFSLAQNWASLDGGLNNGNNIIELFSYDNKLFAGGYFTEAGDVQAGGVAYYADDKWQIVDPSNNNYSTVEHFETLDGILHGFVPFETINEDDSKFMVKLHPQSYQWQIVENSLIKGDVDKAVVFKNELYISGRFRIGENPELSGFAKWEKNHWIDVLPRNETSSSLILINDFEVYQDELYMIGFIPDIDSTSFNRIAKWDGQYWDNLRDGLSFFGFPTSLAVFKNKLYVGGFGFDPELNSSIHSVITWDGFAWRSVPQFENSLTELSVVRRLISFGSKLFISSNTGGGTIYSFNGKELIRIEESLGGSISSLTIHNQELYVGGGFSSFSGPNSVARLIVIDDIPSPANLYELFPNPASGHFTLKYYISEKEDTSIKLNDMTGRCVFEKYYIGESGLYNKIISLPNLTPGIYYLQFQKGKLTETQKIVLVN